MWRCSAPVRRWRLWLGWVLFGDLVLRWIVESRVPADVPVQSPAMLNFFFDDVRRMAAGLPPNAEPNDAMQAAAELWRRLDSIGTIAFIVGALALAAAGIAIGLGRIEQTFRARNRVESLGLGGAAADRRGLGPDHRRDRVLGAVRIGPLLRAGPDRQLPVRARMEPADRDPRGSDRRSGQLRRGPAAHRHAPDHGDRDRGRRAARPVCPRSICRSTRTTNSVPWPSRSWRSWPACRPWSTASSPR